MNFAGIVRPLRNDTFVSIVMDVSSSDRGMVCVCQVSDEVFKTHIAKTLV